MTNINVYKMQNKNLPNFGIMLSFLRYWNDYKEKIIKTLIC